MRLYRRRSDRKTRIPAGTGFYRLDNNPNPADDPMNGQIGGSPEGKRITATKTVACDFLHFLDFVMLTVLVWWDYKPLTNEGGGAAGDRRTRSEISLRDLRACLGFPGFVPGALGG